MGTRYSCAAEAISGSSEKQCTYHHGFEQLAQVNIGVDGNAICVLKPEASLL